MTRFSSLVSQTSFIVDASKLRQMAEQTDFQWCTAVDRQRDANGTSSLGKYRVAAVDTAQLAAVLHQDSCEVFPDDLFHMAISKTLSAGPRGTFFKSTARQPSTAS